MKNYYIQFLAIGLAFFLNGNMLAAQCGTVNCNAQIFASFNSDGMIYVVPEIVTAGDVSNCDLSIALYDSINVEQLIDFTDTLMVDCSYMSDHIFRVRNNENGNICFGTIIFDDPGMNCLTSTDELISDSDILINSNLGVRLPSEISNINYAIYDMTGKELISRFEPNWQFELPREIFNSAGCFIMRLQINNQIISKTFFVL